MQYIQPVVLFDIDYTLFDTELFKKSNLATHRLYKEVNEVLESLNKIAILGIFSEGEIELQKKKLRQTNIDKYFEKDHTHIVLKKFDELKTIFKAYKNSKVFFVDDKLDILYDVKKTFPGVFTIWVKRGFYAENQKEIPGFKPDAIIKSLSEVVKIVHEMLK